MSHFNGTEILKSNWITAEHAAFHFDLPLDLIQAWIRDGELAEWRSRTKDRKILSVSELEVLLKDYAG